MALPRCIELPPAAKRAIDSLPKFLIFQGIEEERNAISPVSSRIVPI